MAAPILSSRLITAHAEELLALLRSAASAAQHGRHSTADRKYRQAWGTAQHIARHIEAAGLVPEEDQS